VRYLTSYRFYTLAKMGIALAYLWFIWDFFWIQVAVGNGLDQLVPASADIIPSVQNRSLTWIFSGAAPITVGLYIWGRFKWLQFAVGCWMGLSMIAMVCSLGAFASVADIWLHYILLAYGLAALVCPAREWEECEPGFTPAAWKENRVLASTYAWLVVVIQFAVYFFSGINKLVDGWTPWTGGVALQNLAFDSSMHDYLRGIHVPYWISFALCYVTLFQRLVVPFGFFWMRYRGWAVLILGSMHVGYDLLMQVAIFPVIGVSSLLMIVPPRPLALPLLSRPTLRQPRQIKRWLEKSGPATPLRIAVPLLFAAWLVVESTRVTVEEAMPWENTLVLVPAWRMFADGGVAAGEKWSLILQTRSGEVDATQIPLRMLPHLWRDRFYVDSILHNVLRENSNATHFTNSMVERLVEATEKIYSDQQLRAKGDPVILKAGFIIQRNH
jgi:hypothetical protein